MKPVKNSVYSTNDSTESSDLYAVIASTDNTSENHLKLRLQEMEELNNHLEELVDLSTKKLIEVGVTNNKFLSILAHDLRSPFCSILGVLEILKKSLNNYTLHEIEKYIDVASNSANKALILLDNLLTWAISQNSEKSFNPIKISLQKLIKEEIDSFNISAKQKQLTLNHSISARVNVSADLQMVKTVIRNLIGNAIKFTNTGGEIFISASEGERFVDIVVKDNGVGISLETQKKIFKIGEFHSTKGTNDEPGTGLGLLLCKEFVEIHGGNIRIESEPGKGSKFIFTLPHYITNHPPKSLTEDK